MGQTTFAVLAKEHLSVAIGDAHDAAAFDALSGHTLRDEERALVASIARMEGRPSDEEWEELKAAAEVLTVAEVRKNIYTKDKISFAGLKTMVGKMKADLISGHKAAAVIIDDPIKDGLDGDTVYNFKELTSL